MSHKELTNKIRQWQLIQKRIFKMKEDLAELFDEEFNLETQIGDTLSPGNMKLNESIGFWIRTDVDREECLIVEKKTTGYSVYIRGTKFNSKPKEELVVNNNGTLL